MGDTYRMSTLSNESARPDSLTIGESRLIEVLLRERAGVIETACFVIRHVLANHYGAATEEETRRRLERLYDHVLSAARCRNLGPIVEYAQHVAVERYDRGYTLTELQAAFNALEEAIWERLVADMPPQEIAEGLTLVSAIFGVAKDTLACAYVAASARARHPSLDLDALAAGSASL